MRKSVTLKQIDAALEKAAVAIQRMAWRRMSSDPESREEGFDFGTAIPKQMRFLDQGLKELLNMECKEAMETLPPTTRITDLRVIAYYDSLIILLKKAGSH